MKTKYYLVAALGAFTICLMPQANAASIVLGGPSPTNRTATLTSAVSGVTGEGNATVTDVQNAYNSPPAFWTERADVTSVGTNGWLTVSLTSGSFGSQPAAGTWTITNNAFWTTYGRGSISMHVGGGQGTPDHFIWLLTPGQLAGTWSYNGGNANGGGLSNLKLYSENSKPGTDDGRKVPDGGTTVAALGFALLGLGSMRKLIGSKA